MNNKISKFTLLFIILILSFYLVRNYFTFRTEIIGDDEAVGSLNGLELKIETEVVNDTAIKIQYRLSNLSDEVVTIYTGYDSAYCKLYGNIGFIRRLEPLVTTEPLWIISLDPGEHVRFPGSQEYVIRRHGKMYLVGVWSYYPEDFSSGENRILNSVETGRISLQVTLTGIQS